MDLIGVVLNNAIWMPSTTTQNYYLPNKHAKTVLFCRITRVRMCVRVVKTIILVFTSIIVEIFYIIFTIYIVTTFY